MNISQDQYEPTHGFCIVHTYEAQYKKWLTDRKNPTHSIYALPSVDKPASEMPIKYRGIDREPLTSFNEADDLARVYIAELESKNLAFEDVIETEEDAKKTLSFSENPQYYEIIWVRLEGNSTPSPENYSPIGFEPIWFVSAFSAINDCMHFCRWHGTDVEGVLFLPYFDQLNEYGIFNTPELAKEFIKFYLSFDWTEQGEYDIAEIFLPLDQN